MRPNSKTYPPVPHKFKMIAKKILRGMNGTSTGWRQLATDTYNEMIEEYTNEQQTR